MNAVVSNPVKVRGIDLISLSKMMSQCINTGLSPTTFVSFLELQILLDSRVFKRARDLQELMASYGIRNPIKCSDDIGGFDLRYDYKKHLNSYEINKKLHAINNEVHELRPCNFIPAPEFHAFTSKSVNGKPLPMNVIVSLSKLLMKK
ncbi:MAG: hypothetical protein WKF87_06760 [Chryseolinea sp.]